MVEIERYHRNMKNVVKPENYYFPDDLKTRIQEFVHSYNNYKYHESLQNVTPADVCFGRREQVLTKRTEIKNMTIRRKEESEQKSKNISLNDY